MEGLSVYIYIYIYVCIFTLGMSSLCMPYESVCPYTPTYSLKAHKTEVIRFEIQS